MKKLSNYIELILLALIVIGATIGEITNSWFITLIIPAIIGIALVLFLNLIKLLAWFEKPKFITFTKRLGKIKQTFTRNKNKIKDIEGNKIDNIVGGDGKGNVHYINKK